MIDTVRRILQASNYYDIFNITLSNFNLVDLKHSYRNIVKKLHPDVISGAIFYTDIPNLKIGSLFYGCNTDGECDLKLILGTVKDGYNILRDEDKRNDYNNVIKVSNRSPILDSILFDEEISGITCLDNHYIDKETRDGTNITIQVPYKNLDKIDVEFEEDCPICGGYGIIVKYGKIKCPQCGGSGKVNDEICLMCNGAGFLGWSNCKRCNTVGRVKSKHKIILGGKDKIMHGFGNKGHLGGKAGNLIIKYKE